MERTLNEIKANNYPILKNSENYQITRIEYDEDYETNIRSLILTLRNKKNLVKLIFGNVVLNEEAILALRDASNLYIIDTSYLGWGKEQRIEIGDWDGGPPIFWAEEVKLHGN